MRMDHHKDKFISPIIFNELSTLEMKKNGKIEHTSTGHDDQIFSYLMALYVWYEGTDLMERYGLQKRSIKSDEDIEEAVTGLEDNFRTTLDDNQLNTDDDMINIQMDYLNSDNSMLYHDWVNSEINKDLDAMNDLLSTQLGRKAYSNKYNINESDITNGMTNIPQNIFDDFNAS